MEELWRNLRYGNLKAIWHALVFRVKKNTGHINYQ
jgi:hypothetical protein